MNHDDDDPGIDESGMGPVDTTFVSRFAIKYGEMFLDATDLKDRLMDWSVDAHFGYKLDKSDKQRVVAKCRTTNAQDAAHCPFYVRASVRSGSGMFVVDGEKFNPCHTCPRDSSLSRSAISKQRWLGRRVHEVIEIDSTTSPTAIHTAIVNR